MANWIAVVVMLLQWIYAKPADLVTTVRELVATVATAESPFYAITTTELDGVRPYGADTCSTWVTVAPRSTL